MIYWISELVGETEFKNIIQHASKVNRGNFLSY
jgi:hypothetical protein